MSSINHSKLSEMSKRLKAKSDMAEEALINKEDATNDDISKNASKTYLTNEFYDKVIKYVSTDDLIRKKTKEHNDSLKNLKQSKTEYEEFIIKYLGTIGEEYVDIKGKGKITRKEKITKGSIKYNNIKESLTEQLIQDDLIPDDGERAEFVESVLGLIEDKREVKSKVVLERTFEKN